MQSGIIEKSGGYFCVEARQNPNESLYTTSCGRRARYRMVYKGPCCDREGGARANVRHRRGGKGGGVGGDGARRSLKHTGARPVDGVAGGGEGQRGELCAR